MAQPSDPASDLSQYQWRNRIILLFAPTAGDTRYKEQGAVLEGARGGLQNRETVVFHLVGRSGYEGEQALTQSEVADLRERFDSGEDAFVFVLIGKDGTVKRRTEVVVSAADLFRQIDAMPMRQREMNSP